MDYSRIKKRYSYKELLYKLALFVVTVGVIVYFFPRDEKFSYQFDEGKPWKYGELIASFDFPIYKSDSQIKTEQDSVLKTFSPYYLKNKEIETKTLTKLLENYKAYLKNELPSSKYYHYIESQLKKIYKTGIIASDDFLRLAGDSVFSIMLVEDIVASKTSLGSLYTVKTAYEEILYGDTAHFDPEVLKRCTLNEYIFSNLDYEKEQSETVKNELLAGIPLAKGVVLSGQKIVGRGEIINAYTYSVLQSLKKESTNRSGTTGMKWQQFIGHILLVGIIIALFMLYLELFRVDFYEKRGAILLLFSLMIFFSVLTGLMVRNNIMNVYVIPYAMLPIIIRVFLDSRTAFTSYILTLLICASILKYPYEFVLLQATAGLVAIFSLRELSQRSQLFKSAILILGTYVLAYMGYELINEADISTFNMARYRHFAINGIFLLFTYPLLFIMEKAFGFTSNVTLVELSNTNNPLLKQLSETAPGTFQHSMQMANLASEAARYIGANSQLVRTGALYHDIGKMVNPIFFTENQPPGVDPHKNLSYEESARVVISHVTDGLKLADKHGLPQSIKDFIVTHHGKGKTMYFYVSWMNEHPGEEPDVEQFTYPGPNPFTRETAILMMADSVEAASRSLPSYTEESISELVEKIINKQMESGFFEVCPITFKDIQTVKAVFKEKLKTIYHTRISYPELKK